VAVFGHISWPVLAIYLEFPQNRPRKQNKKTVHQHVTITLVIGIYIAEIKHYLEIGFSSSIVSGISSHKEEHA